MICRLFFTLFLTLTLAASGYCFDIVYPLTGHEFMPVKKGSLHIELASKTINTEFYSTTDSSYIDKIEFEVNTLSLFSAYDLTDKMSLNIDLPYVNVQRKSSVDNTIKENGIGDISIGVKYQITDQKLSFINSFFNFTAILPTGKSPYEITPNAEELSTGSGGYSAKPEITFAKTIKNTLLFCSIFYQYNFPINDLDYHRSATDGEAGIYMKSAEPGDEFGGSIGFVEKLYENISCMIRYNSYRAKPIHYDWVGRADYDGESADFSTLSTGIGFQLPSKLAVLTTFSTGIGNEAPDYEVELSIAF